MKVIDYLKIERYTEEDQGEGYILNVSEMIDLLNGFSKHQNKELILCLKNSTKIMEGQEGEVMDLVICQTMNNQIKWNRETLKSTGNESWKSM